MALMGPAGGAPLLSQTEQALAQASAPTVEATVTAPQVAQETLRVLVPQGVAAGTKVAFTTPDGQRLMVQTVDAIAPGGSVSACYTPLAPAAAPAAAANRGPVPPMQQLMHNAPVDENRQAANQSWAMYAISMACCFCCGPLACVVSPALWLIASAMYFCKPESARARLPGQRAPALLALITCLVVVIVGALFAAGFLGFLIGATTQGHNGQPHPVFGGFAGKGDHNLHGRFHGNFLEHRFSGGK